MTAIRAIFDGKAFIPQEPFSLPAKSEVLVLVEGGDQAQQQQLDQAIQAYYQAGDDTDDQAWGRAAAAESHRAWDED